MTDTLKSTNTCFTPVFSLRNRVARFIWNIVYIFCFRISPRPFHAWRRWLLKCFGAKLGKACRIYPKTTIWAPWNLVCGDHVIIADNVTLYNQAPIRIENSVVISQNTHLCTGTHDYGDINFRLYTKSIEIKKSAWICAEAFILPGIIIGEGAVIGARSVVTKDMPSWMVCAGNPCRPIKQRVQDLKQ